MQIDGKLARLKALTRAESPGFAARHERPFSMHFSYKGPLAIDKAKSFQLEKQKDDETINALLPIFPNPIRSTSAPGRDFQTLSTEPRA